MIKELWLKERDKQKYLEEEQEIMRILNEKETVDEEGHNVVLYITDTRSVKRFGCRVFVDESLINDLEEILGNGSVKVVQKEGPEEEYRRMYEQYIDEMCHVPGTDENTRLELMKIQRLDRIADVLEDINGTLISMSGDIESLGECVGVIPARYTQGIDVHFLRIIGSVDTGI